MGVEAAKTKLLLELRHFKNNPHRKTTKIPQVQTLLEVLITNLPSCQTEDEVRVALKEARTTFANIWQQTHSSFFYKLTGYKSTDLYSVLKFPKGADISGHPYSARVYAPLQQFYRIQYQNKTIHLYGTIHVIDASKYMMGKNVLDCMQNSQRTYFENAEQYSPQFNKQMLNAIYQKTEMILYTRHYVSRTERAVPFNGPPAGFFEYLDRHSKMRNEAKNGFGKVERDFLEFYLLAIDQGTPQKPFPGSLETSESIVTSLRYEDLGFFWIDEAFTEQNLQKWFYQARLAFLANDLKYAHKQNKTKRENAKQKHIAELKEKLGEEAYSRLRGRLLEEFYPKEKWEEVTLGMLLAWEGEPLLGRRCNNMVDALIGAEEENIFAAIGLDHLPNMLTQFKAIGARIDNIPEEERQSFADYQAQLKSQTARCVVS